MPIYEYKCENGHTFEVIQRMSDDPVTECEVCAAPVERVFHPVAVHFKGSGFYTTDYGNKSKSGASADGSDSSGSGESKGSDSDSKSSSADSNSSSSSSKPSSGDGKAKAGSSTKND